MCRDSNKCITKKITITQQVVIPFSDRHLDEFISLKCARDLMSFFPNAKEITESMGAFAAFRKIKHLVNFLDLVQNPNVICLVPGDGKHPRTGAVAAYRSKWQVYSIDPTMVQDDPEIKRLIKVKAKIEDWKNPHEKYDIGIVLAVHSHAPLTAAVNHHLGRCNQIIVIALPCCVEQTIIIGDRIIPRDIQYRDPGIHSPQDEVLIWVLEQ